MINGIEKRIKVEGSRMKFIGNKKDKG